MYFIDRCMPPVSYWHCGYTALNNLKINMSNLVHIQLKVYPISKNKSISLLRFFVVYRNFTFLKCFFYIELAFPNTGKSSASSSAPFLKRFGSDDQDISLLYLKVSSWKNGHLISENHVYAHAILIRCRAHRPSNEFAAF